MLPLFVTFGNKTNEVRLSPSDSILRVKERLHVITGYAPDSMRLSLHGQRDALKAACLLDELKLASYGPEAYDRIHVASSEPSPTAAFEDLSALPKYEMPIEAYLQRPDNASQFVQSVRKAHGIALPDKQELESEALAALHLGDRVLVVSTDKPTSGENEQDKVGYVRYLGPLEGRPGLWVGVAYDRPVGKHDGTFGDRRYFEAKEKHGAFVRPTLVHTLMPTDMDEELEALTEI